MKFKNIKKKISPVGTKNKKSPSNYRTNPESARTSKLLGLYGRALKTFVILIFMVTVVVVGLDLQNNLQAKQRIDSQRKALIADLSFWKDFISKHQNYRDAYFQASILEYRLGDTFEAKMYTQKGLSLDPNSINGEKLEKFLVDK